MENRTTRKIDIDTTSVLSFTQKPSIKSCKQKENWRWGNNKHQWNSLIDGVFIYMTAQNVNIQSSRSHIRRRHAYTILGNKSHQLQLWWCICCYYCCSDSLHEIVCVLTKFIREMVNTERYDNVVFPFGNRLVHWRKIALWLRWDEERNEFWIGHFCRPNEELINRCLGTIRAPRERAHI